MLKHVIGLVTILNRRVKPKPLLESCHVFKCKSVNFDQIFAVVGQVCCFCCNLATHAFGKHPRNVAAKPDIQILQKPSIQIAGLKTFNKMQSLSKSSRIQQFAIPAAHHNNGHHFRLLEQLIFLDALPSLDLMLSANPRTLLGYFSQGSQLISIRFQWFC